jgi:hypothetical protein
MTALSPLTMALVKKIFPNHIDEAKQLLEEQCGQNLPFCENGTPESLERLRFAALKVSNGKLGDLIKAVNLAKIDWRDLLVWADFANDLEAHSTWAKQILAI